MEDKRFMEYLILCMGKGFCDMIYGECPICKYVSLGNEMPDIYLFSLIDLPTDA